MDKKGFLKSGHTPSLVSSFLYFDVSFMIWALMGPLSVMIMTDLDMNAAQKANLVALPLLGGSILRLVFGFLTDYIGPKRTGQIGMILTMVPLLWGWLLADSLTELYGVALLLGVAGASFAAALPLASRWYPPQYQGLAMGIAGAGNSGTVFATLFANRLAQHYGDWGVVFGLALIPILLVFIIFTIFAKDSPNQPAPRKLADYGKVLKIRDTWKFCFLYSVTFGGFAGMASYLTIFFHTQYGLNPVRAADFATICVIAGSFFRPLGGYLSDKVGGIRILFAVFTMAALGFMSMSFLPGLGIATVLLFIIMMSLGMGNGAVFQLVPLRFQKEIGMITGIVGAAGGLGGYMLPRILGNLKLSTGSFTIGFLILGGITVACVLLLLLTQKKWQNTWVHAGGQVKGAGSAVS